MSSYWKEEIDAVMARDPAAKSRLEIFLCYPGIKALRSHRLAHSLFKHGHTLLARLISQRSKRKTGIEIHPGAVIGHRLFIDIYTKAESNQSAVDKTSCSSYNVIKL